MTQQTNSREITIADQLIVCRELSVLQVRKWIEESGSQQPLDIISAALFPDCSLDDLKRMTDLDNERIDKMKPSQIQAIIAVCKELNPHFFALLGRLTSAFQGKA